MMTSSAILLQHARPSRATWLLRALALGLSLSLSLSLSLNDRPSQHRECRKTMKGGDAFHADPF